MNETAVVVLVWLSMFVTPYLIGMMGERLSVKIAAEKGDDLEKFIPRRIKRVFVHIIMFLVSFVTLQFFVLLLKILVNRP